MDGIFGSRALPKVFSNDIVFCMNTNQSACAIAKACGVLGSQLALATRIAAAPAQVSQWVSGVRPVPPRHCLAIERATAGQVTRADLRPDDFWLIWPDLPAPSKEAA